jgi:hypothetical protein
MSNSIGMDVEKLRRKDVGFNFDGEKIHTSILMGIRFIEDFCPNSICITNSIKRTGYEVHLEWKVVGFTYWFS